MTCRTDDIHQIFHLMAKTGGNDSCDIAIDYCAFKMIGILSVVCKMAFSCARNFQFRFDNSLMSHYDRPISVYHTASLARQPIQYINYSVWQLCTLHQDKNEIFPLELTV
jgi:hypothetical protein